MAPDVTRQDPFQARDQMLKEAGGRNAPGSA